MSTQNVFELDGKIVSWEEQITLNEYIRSEKKHFSGFCDHPLIENTRSCLLCQVYDEKKQEVVKACEVLPEVGSRYLTDHPSLLEARSEVERLYSKGHDFTCSRCSNSKNCDLKSTFKQSLSDINSAFNNKKLEGISLSDKILVEFSQCIECSLCTDFEKAHSSKPALVESKNIPEVQGKFDHNYGINLIDLCPTGCFSLVEERKRSPAEVLKFQDFCRGCDRLCEVEVLYEKRGEQALPIRARAPQFSAHWVCDEVNNQWQKRLSIPLTRSLKKTADGWYAHEGLKVDGPWHIIAPKNLPQEMWNIISEWYQRNNSITLEFFEWQERKQEKGILRSHQTFEQEEQVKLEQLIQKRSPDEKVQVCLIAPEWKANENQWQELLSKVKSFPKKVFMGAAIEFELYNIMDELIACPSYDELSWSGRNYQNEPHHKAGKLIQDNIFERVLKL